MTRGVDSDIRKSVRQEQLSYENWKVIDLMFESRDFTARQVFSSLFVVDVDGKESHVENTSRARVVYARQVRVFNLYAYLGFVFRHLGTTSFRHLGTTSTTCDVA